MKVYIQTDIEGVAGVVFFENRKNDSAENLAHRLRVRKLLTNEVNAAALGAFDAGATTVLINDNHGCCDSIFIEQLDPRCEVIHGRSTAEHWLPELDELWDALVLIGMHAMAGTPKANLPHSQWLVNGGEYLLSEASMAAALAGDRGIPTVFISGDQFITEEVQQKVPAIGTAVVKKSLGPYQARSLVPERACALIRDGVRMALERRAAIAPFKIPGPVSLNLNESVRGNHNQQEGFSPVLSEDVKGSTMNEVFTELLARMPWFTTDITLPDGFEYP